MSSAMAGRLPPAFDPVSNASRTAEGSAVESATPRNVGRAINGGRHETGLAIAV